MKNLRKAIMIITLVLLCFGLVMVYSSSAIYAFDLSGDSLYFFKKHLFFLFIGICAAMFVMLFEMDTIRKITKPLMLFSILLLILVRFTPLGMYGGGAKRWLKIAMINFQPSEIWGLSIVLYLADLLSRKQKVIKSFIYGFLPGLIMLIIGVFLILLQPDLGNAIVLTLVSIIMFFASGIRMRYLYSIILCSLPVLYFLIFNAGYRKRRILAFINPWIDPKGVGYQIIQSYIAFGCGNLFGKGLGASRQKLFYLPQSYTDFIFSIVGEELGLAGTLGVVLLFGLFIVIGLRMAFRIKNFYNSLVIVGVVSLIGLKAMINISVCTGVLPTKGLPLPFISYGGSSLIFNLIGVGLLLNASRNAEPKMGIML